jgi:hypothetical protein
MTTPFDTYLAQIQADLKGGQATEHTYRSALETLLESLAPNIKASNDPKHIQCGAPDFVVERGHVPLGYVETKDVGTDLDKEEKKDQLKRYRGSLANLILTDYLEFRWYVNGQHRLTARLATVGKGHKVTVDPQATDCAPARVEVGAQSECVAPAVYPFNRGGLYRFGIPNPPKNELGPLAATPYSRIPRASYQD